MPASLKGVGEQLGDGQDPAPQTLGKLEHAPLVPACLPPSVPSTELWDQQPPVGGTNLCTCSLALARISHPVLQLSHPSK